MKSKSVDTSIKLGNKSLYVNKKEADKLISNITKELEKISKSLSSVGTDMSVLSNSNNLTKISKKCLDQCQEANNIIELIKNEYNNDLKDYAIDLLNQRISDLEKQISKM